MIKYGYYYQRRSSYRGEWVGYYQCDEEDFKKMWKKIKDGVKVCYVFQTIGNKKKVYSYVRGEGWKVIV